MDVGDGEVKHRALPHKFLLHDFSSNLILFRPGHSRAEVFSLCSPHSSSSVELKDSNLDIFYTLFLAGIDFLATFIGDGDGSLNVTWPWMYGVNVVIKLWDVSIATLKDLGPHESLTIRSSDTYIFLTPFEHSTSNIRLRESGYS